MADLNLIVKLTASGNHRIFKGPAVNRGIGADFDVVFNRYAPDLRDFDPFASKRRKPEAVGADHAA